MSCTQSSDTIAISWLCFRIRPQCLYVHVDGHISEYFRNHLIVFSLYTLYQPIHSTILLPWAFTRSRLKLHCRPDRYFLLSTAVLFQFLSCVGPSTSVPRKSLTTRPLFQASNWHNAPVLWHFHLIFSVIQFWQYPLRYLSFWARELEPKSVLVE